MKRFILLLSMLISIGYVNAENLHRFKIKVNKQICYISFFSPRIVRIVKFPINSTQPTDRKSLVVTMTPEKDIALSYKENSTGVTISSSQLTVMLNKKTGNIQFLHKRKNLLREKGCYFEKRTTGRDANSYKINQTYTLDKDEPIYGLGTIQDGKLNRRGTNIFMEQSNLQDFQYVIQSIKGWGIYWDNYSRAKFDDSNKGMSFTAEVGDYIDYYFMYGGSADGLNAQMRELSGKVPMPPMWTFGYCQSRERYKSSKELLDVLNKYRQLKVPIDGIIQDWQYWGSNYTWNAMDFLSENFANGKQMINQIHNNNAHLMISIWSSFGPETKAYKQLDKEGLLFNIQTWPQSGLSFWPPRMDYPSGVRVYDCYSQKGRDIYWNNLKTLFNDGVDAWWMDSSEPDYFNSKDTDYEHMTGLGSWRRVRNAFPLCTVSGVYNHQRKASSDKRVFIMTRSAFAGQQRYGANMWSGDVTSSWDMLRKQIPAGLNFSLTGDPNFNTDIGGFFCGSYNTKGPCSASRNPQYRELYVRWLQYGLFCPIFRSHGTDSPREIYYFGKKGEPIYDAIDKSICLRYKLLPYIYSTAWQVTHNDKSYMRALISDFPSDKKVWNLCDEFMFGQSILATPIVKSQYTDEQVIKEDAMTGWNKRNNTPDASDEYKPIDFTATKEYQKYLPKGAKWYYFWTNKLYDGGQKVNIQTSIDQVPMFVRAGSIIPIGPAMQYVGQKPWDNLEIRVYPGADATFTLYEDEGDSYDYEKGIFSTIEFHWNEKKHQLIITDRKGQYPGMLQKRKFNIQLVGTSLQKTIEYDGSEKIVEL